MQSDFKTQANELARFKTIEKQLNKVIIPEQVTG